MSKMRKIVETPYYSKRIGRLPEGCRICVKGAKLVLLATGVCGRGCWYCPLSERKRGKDVVVANEWWVRKDRDVLEEARLTGAEGAGITGGDPLCRLDRTLRYIRLLKKSFGGGFHIHLYTPGKLATSKTLARLHDAGLDEIRFHPDFLGGGRADLSAVKAALKFDWDVGCEIPVVPGRLRQTRDFIDAADEAGVGFLNLNQFEVSETNALALERRGFHAESDESFAVAGSGSVAGRLLEHCAENTGLRVHYCTVRLKDGVQLKNRLRRRAKNVAREYDIITDEGLLLRGAVYLPETLPSFDYVKRIAGMGGGRNTALIGRLEAARRLLSGAGVEPALFEVDSDRLRVLTGAWVVEELAGELKAAGFRPAVVEEYPTWDRLLTDLKPL